jgi:hypothetical protein
MVWRALQLLISTSMLVAVLVMTVPYIIDLRFTEMLVPGSLLLLATIILWYNAKLNWLLLRSYDFTFVPKRTGWIHVASLAFIPIIIYCCANLSISYDSHLSTYDVSVRLPLWLSRAEAEWQSNLTIVRSEVGVYLLLCYVFVLSFALKANNSGWFSISGEM